MVWTQNGINTVTKERPTERQAIRSMQKAPVLWSWSARRGAQPSRSAPESGARCLVGIRTRSGRVQDCADTYMRQTAMRSARRQNEKAAKWQRSSPLAKPEFFCYRSLKREGRRSPPGKSGRSVAQRFVPPSRCLKKSTTYRNVNITSIQGHVFCLGFEADE
jgi:hypothetical protein